MAIYFSDFLYILFPDNSRRPKLPEPFEPLNPLSSYHKHFVCRLTLSLYPCKYYPCKKRTTNCKPLVKNPFETIISFFLSSYTSCTQNTSLFFSLSALFFRNSRSVRTSPPVNTHHVSTKSLFKARTTAHHKISLYSHKMNANARI